MGRSGVVPMCTVEARWGLALGISHPPRSVRLKSKYVMLWGNSLTWGKILLRTEFWVSLKK